MNKKNLINEYDMTKSMLNTIRSLIKENENSNPEISDNEIGDINNSQSREIIVVKDGQKENDKLFDYYEKDTNELLGLIPDITFYNYSIIPKEGVKSGDVLFSGKLNAYGIDFTMNKEDSLGLRISSTMPVRLDDNLMTTLKTLNSFYQNWQKEWAIELNKENFTNV
jgi:hypothetical protein